MLSSDLKTAIRYLRRNPVYSLINVVGLSVGLASALVILLHLQGELSYDRFHSTAEQTYRLTTTVVSGDDASTYATTVPALGPEVAERIPEVTYATRLLVEATESSEALFAADERRAYEARFAWTDSSFFDVFPFEFTEGSAGTALNKPFSIVLTETTARKYFGDDEALGKTLRWNERFDLEVTGVISEMPERAHFHFDLLGSLQTFKGLGADGMIDNWGYRGFYTYLLLKGDSDSEEVEAKIANLTEARRAEMGGVEFHLQPVASIHLQSDLEEEIEANSYMLLVYLLGSVAGIMLVVASVNFINLTTARATRRAREVGVRKVLGAQRGRLIRQFLTETFLLALGGLIGAFSLASAFWPLLTSLTGTAHLTDHGLLLVGFAILALLLGLLAGCYPAFYLSRFRPTAALKDVHSGELRGSAIRSGLVVTQFALSVALIVGALVIHQQLTYMRTADLGFEKEQVVAVPLRSVFGQPQQDVDQLREELVRIAGVEEVSATSQLPSRAFVNNWSARSEGATATEAVEMTAFAVQSEFLSAFGARLVGGRDFSEDRGAEDQALIVNEAAARRFGWEQPVGSQLFSGESGEALGTVIGVVADFHYQSLRYEVGPTLFRLGGPFDFQYMIVRFTGDRTRTMAAVADVWSAGSPDWPFSYLSLDEEFDRLNHPIERTGRVIGLFALLAIFVACLGTVGLTSFVIEQRTKEFGIRRVLGASFASIIRLLTGHHVRLILASLLVAVPVAYVAADRWLQDFAYRTEPGPGVFILAGFLALGLALVTVSALAVKIARTSPVNSLRYE